MAIRSLPECSQKFCNGCAAENWEMENGTDAEAEAGAALLNIWLIAV